MMSIGACVVKGGAPMCAAPSRRCSRGKRMLRIYFLQEWFNLSDPAVEEALYDSLAMRRFVDIDLGREPAPDETTVCRFCHLLEANDRGQKLFDKVQRHLAAKGLKVVLDDALDRAAGWGGHRRVRIAEHHREAKKGDDGQGAAQESPLPRSRVRIGRGRL